ncbi:MAG: ABC transporter substrate-binding protein [Bdellovibrionales bacterium]|nr:ABC transporter substrate-binding protein [Bdellovibrionales bacterium]
MIMKSNTLATFTSTIFLAALLALAQTSCTKKAADDPKTLYVGLSSAPATLDPRNAMDAGGMRLTGLLFSSIVRLGPDLEIIGEAATSWSYKNLVYTFNLRPGLKFVDEKGGTFPVTKEDILFSIETFRTAGRFASSLEPIAKVEATYDVATGGQLTIQLKSYSATLLTDLTPVKILPKNIVTEKGDAFRDHPIGSGPFRFVSADANEIKIRANPDCAYVQPKMENIVFKIVREDNTRFLKVLKGELDLVQQELPPSKVMEIEKKGGFQVFKYPGLSMTYLLVNLKDTTFQTKESRQALSAAINREEIIRFKLEGLAQPATSILSPINPYHDVSLSAPKFDLESAKSLIKSAGLEGKEVILKTSNSTQAVENGKVLANQLEQAGLKVKLQSFEWATFYKDMDQGNFQLATMKWVGTTDPDIYKTAFHSQEVPPKGRNRGSYNNPALDKLVDQGRGIEDTRKRIDHYKKVQKMIYADLPMVPLWYEFEVAVASQKVKDYSPSKNGDYSSLTKVQKE